MGNTLKIGIIGSGKVATSIAFALKEKWELIGVYDVKEENLKRATQLLRAPSKSKEAIVTYSDIIFFGTPDDEIANAYSKVEHLISHQKFLFHFSGALTSNVFKKGKRGSIHPIFPFNRIIKDSRVFSNIYFGIEGDKEAVELARELVDSIGGKSIPVSPQNKVFYHLMCVFASNMLVGIIEASRRCGKQAGIKEPLRVVKPLAKKSLLLAIQENPKRALTGPLVRKDVKTIEKHLKVLEKLESLKNIYTSISSLLKEIACKL